MGRASAIVFEPAQRKLGLLFLALATACGGARSEPKAMTAVAMESGPMPAESMTVPPLTELTRVEVDEALKAGFSRFLQEVRLEAALDDGRFVGFRIAGFSERKKWEGVGIEVGDVITRVNELPIERPEQAYVAFLALRTRTSLDVAYLRNGKEMRLSLPIVGESARPDPSTGGPSPASSSAAEAPASSPSDKTNPVQPRPASR